VPILRWWWGDRHLAEEVLAIRCPADRVELARAPHTEQVHQHPETVSEPRYGLLKEYPIRAADLHLWSQNRQFLDWPSSL
jgi:hypothetical protein